MVAAATSGTTGGKALWYLTRGTGTMALLLLTASMLLGILEVKRWQSPRWPRFVTAGLHRNLSLLSVAFVAVHVATTVVDGFAPIGWLDTVIPFRSPYRPIWLGLGAVSVDLLIALVVTSLLRGRIGYRAWRALHWAAYGCWPVALMHGLGTGTDIRQAWAVALNIACLASIVGAVWWRLAEAWDARPAPAAIGAASTARRVVVPAIVASVVMPIAIVAWLLAGPLQPGWAARAGTPSAIRRSGSSSAVAAPLAGPNAASPTVPAAPTTTGPQTAASFRLPASAQLRGSLTQTTGTDGQTIVTIDTTLSTPPASHLVIALHGNALAGGGIAMLTSQVTAGPTAGPPEYRGTVTALQGSRLTLTVASPGSAPVVIQVRLTIAGSTVSGTMTEGSASA